MAPVAAAMAWGIVADRLVEPWGTATWATIALAASATLALVRRRPWAANAAVLIALAAFGGAWHHRCWSDLAPDDLSRFASTEPRPAWLRGVVSSVPEYRPGSAGSRPDDPGDTRFALVLTASGDGHAWYAASGGVIVTVGGDRSALRMGDPVEAAGALARLAGPLNPGERDSRDYHRALGIRLRLSVDAPEGLALDPTGRPDRRLRWLGQVRTAAERRLLGLFDDRTGPLASALLLGRRSGVDGRAADAFLRTGTIHVIAISGMHLSAMAGVLGLAAGLVGLGPKGAARLVLAATIAYATVVGWSPSVARSAATVAAVCLAVLLERSHRRANTIAMAIVFTLLLNPASLFNVGWQLSFLSVAVLLFGMPPLLRRLGRLGRGPESEEDPLDALERRFEPPWKTIARRTAWGLVAAFGASTTVWLATAPLVAWRFNLVSPIGVPLNLPLIPVVGLALTSGFAALVLGAIWPPLAGPAAWTCDRMLGLTLTIVSWGEAAPMGHAFIPAPPTGWVVAFYASLAVAARASAARWPKAARRASWAGVGLIAAAGSVVVMTPRRPGAVEVEVLAVGHGLATLIQGPDGSAALYDCGRAGDPSVGRRIAAPALWGRGVRRLETVVLSHADADHYNGLPDLLDRFGVGLLVIPDGFLGPDNPGAAAVLDEARARGIPIRSAAAGDRVALVPGLVSTVLHPGAGWLPGASDNDRSLVLDLPLGDRHVLLTGDLDGAGLAELVALPGRRVDVMLAPHHGGRSANPIWLYDWARTGAVVVSQRAPRPGTSDAMEQVARLGIDVRRTWSDGAVLIRPHVAESSAGLDVLAARPPGRQPATADPIVGRAAVASLMPGPSAEATATRWLVAIAGLGMGAWLGFALAVVRFGAWALVLPGRGFGQAEELPGPWRSVEVVADDGVRLRGWWREADGAGLGVGAAARVALVVHGLAEASPSMRARGEALHRAGWSVLLPDLRSFGRSDGVFASYGAAEAGDLRRWIDAVSADRPGVTVALWGRSMGAAVALRAAAEDGRVAAVVLEAPYADLRRALASRLARLPLPGASLLAVGVLAHAARLAGAPIDRPRPIDVARRVVVPALILLGEADRVAPAAEVRRFADAFPSDRRPEVAPVPGAGHADVFEVGGPELERRIVTFLKQACRAR